MIGNHPVILLSAGLAKESETSPSPDEVRLKKNYADSFRFSGAVPLIAPGGENAEELCAMADGLLLTGGADVDPARYGEELRPACGGIRPDRDETEWALMDAFIKAGKPVFGICRGHQFINVYFGGSLYQDIETEAGFPHPRVPHMAHALPGSFFEAHMGSEFRINSFHHQAVNRLGNGLVATVVSADGGLCEAMVHESLPVMSVQWHPEAMTGSIKHDVTLPDMGFIFDEWTEVMRRLRK